MGTPLHALRAQVFAELGGTALDASPNAYPPGAVDDSGLAQPVVNVELTQEQFTQAVALAKQWFTAKKGFSAYRLIPTLANTTSYIMQNDVVTVLDVIFDGPSDLTNVYTLGFFDLIPAGPNYGIPTRYADLSTFTQFLQFTEQRKNMFGGNPEWSYESQTKTLSTSKRANGGFLIAKVVLDSFDPVNLSGKDDYIFGRWVRAKCREIVGRIRSKYENMPTAGGSISMDGRELIAEAKEEFLALDQEIFWSQGCDAIVLG